MDVVRRLVEARPDMWSLAPAPTWPGPAQKINDFIYCSPGVSNVYMLLTDAGRIVINTGMGFETPTHKAKLAEVCGGPTPYVILTQGHVDHVGGVSQMHEPATKLIAQRNNPDCQYDDVRISGARSRQSRVWFPGSVQTLETMQRQPAASPVAQDRPTPDIMFDDHLDLEVGGLKLELLSVPGGETIDSLAIHLPDHKIVFTGNMFGPLFPHFPNLYTIRGDRYRYAEPYLASLARVRALEPEILITGHFDPIVGKDLIRACLDRLEAAVSHVHRATLDGMNAGKDIWTLMREVELPDDLYVGQAYGKVSWCVRSTWDSYMGWFKGEPTSDLYPTQPHHLYADLVELAGIDAVVAHGRAKLGAGDPEAANLLAEVALAKDAGHAGALRLSLDAHQGLFDRSDKTNFWEIGWLRHQIARLQGALGQG